MTFVFINHNVLDNLFYILVSILMFFVLFDNVKKFKNHKNLLLTVSMSLPIVLCMKFPIYIDQYCVHDLRQIPLFIGTLYGGWAAGAALLIISLSTRFAIYGFNSLTLVVYLVLYLATALFSIKFNRMNKKSKLMTSALLIFVLELLTTEIALKMSDYFKVTEAYIFYFIMIPPVAMFFLVYLIEVLMDTIHIRSNIVKIEKMDVVSQLAASISHEVRNPLTVVKGFIELLKTPDLSQNDKERYIQYALKELRTAESIISDYLAFAKPAIEKVEPILIDKEIKNLIEVIKPFANMNAVKVTNQLASGMVLVNTNYFRQCILNLMKNAIEAMENGGELKVLSLTDKNHAIIKISDNGIGMSKEQINRYGEPYYSSKEKGTGLGSMVVLKTVQTMNGKLDIESVPSDGTTIMITLPLYNSDPVYVKEQNDSRVKLKTGYYI
ncbi:ATP-binding protein [Neobacillus ginsengisoli]|uniref:histidine kinase n=1 Tax=Neobacillus ginsengisoli TaxID=904295 RepID=A0ABT9Y246_9BACI|nr:sensor histidine kinase [Neobacillus ginsengisoli]MDQ0201646.1 two-component system sporulation sensor kinase B [Neobacillus ginsengisoli]